MGESLTYAMYNAMAIKQDFRLHRFFPFDPDDLAALLRRKEEILEALDESEQVVSQIDRSLSASVRGKVGRQMRMPAIALAIAWAQTSAEGYHRTAEYHRRLLILREL